MKKIILALIGIGVTASATVVAVKWQSHPRSSAKILAPSALAAAPRSNGSGFPSEAPAPETPHLDPAEAGLAVDGRDPPGGEALLVAVLHMPSTQQADMEGLEERAQHRHVGDVAPEVAPPLI